MTIDDVPPQTNYSPRLGLDAYTIRVIRDEAKGEAEEFRRE